MVDELVTITVSYSDNWHRLLTTEFSKIMGVDRDVFVLRRARDTKPHVASVPLLWPESSYESTCTIWGKLVFRFLLCSRRSRSGLGRSDHLPAQFGQEFLLVVVENWFQHPRVAPEVLEHAVLSL